MKALYFTQEQKERRFSRDINKIRIWATNLSQWNKQKQQDYVVKTYKKLKQVEKITERWLPQLIKFDSRLCCISISLGDDGMWNHLHKDGKIINTLSFRGTGLKTWKLKKFEHSVQFYLMNFCNYEPSVLSYTTLILLHMWFRDSPRIKLFIKFAFYIQLQNYELWQPDSWVCARPQDNELSTVNRPASHWYPSGETGSYI
jgi:hypothetical protein